MTNPLKRIWIYISRRKIRSQLILVYFFAGLLPILIVGSYLLINNRNLVLKQHANLTDAYNARTKGIIADITFSVNNLASNIFNDNQLQNILSERYLSEQQANEACSNYNSFDTLENNYVEIRDISLYCSNSTMSNYGHFRVATPNDKNTEWYKIASQSSTSHWLTWSYNDDYGNRIVQLRFVHRIPVLKTDEYAILVVDINSNHLKSQISTDSPETVLSVNKDPVFFSSAYNYNGQRIPLAIDYQANVLRTSGINKFDGADNFLEVSSLTPVNSDDKIYIATIDCEALPAMNGIFINCLLIVFISLLVPFITIVYFTKAFSDRVNTLKSEMHKVGRGNYDIIETFNGSDELMELFKELKMMIENIKSRDSEIFQDRIVKQQLINHQQKMEFKMLSSQINPHFLYNTLETIRMKAYVNGDLEVANAVKLLGKSMRHVLETGSSTVTLQSELMYIQVYLEIMKIRFKDKINYEFSVSEEIDCDSYKILPLLLQPIVENAVIHGLEEQECGGLIRIKIEKGKNNMLVTLSDNGCGMTQEQLKQLTDKINENSEIASGKIGLHNVQKRLKMFYGEDYGLNIASIPGAGTKVVMTLPLYWEDD